MSLYKNYATDSVKEQTGVPITFEPNDDGTIPTFICSRIGESNKEYTKALRHATKPYERQIALKTLPQEKDAEIYLNVFVDTILKGWSNVRDETNVDMPFNKANAKKLLTDLPDLYTELKNQAGEAALFHKYGLEDEAKN